jgi:endonuclease/exonuclease/phosphatase family metal-dependent hydrolase
MKIAVRNVAGAFYPSNRYRTSAVQSASWDALLATGAEILLVQEATGVGTPLVLPEGWDAHPASPLDRGAGSVVAAAAHLDVDLQWRPEHPLLDALGAYLDFGVLRGHGDDIALVSVHAPGWRPETWAATGLGIPQPTGLHRPWPSDLILDALVSLLDGRPAILAGDWNEATNYPQDDDEYAAAFFNRARNAGLVEVVSDTFGGPVRTNFTRQAKRSYQNDHVFITMALAERVRSVCVWNEPRMALSDHAGIVISLDH